MYIHMHYMYWKLIACWINGFLSLSYYICNSYVTLSVRVVTLRYWHTRFACDTPIGSVMPEELALQSPWCSSDGGWRDRLQDMVVLVRANGWAVPLMFCPIWEVPLFLRERFPIIQSISSHQDHHILQPVTPTTIRAAPWRLQHQLLRCDWSHQCVTCELGMPIP